jgi:hypothetical protein
MIFLPAVALYRQKKEKEKGGNALVFHFLLEKGSAIRALIKRKKALLFQFLNPSKNLALAVLKFTESSLALAAGGGLNFKHQTSKFSETSRFKLQ